MTSILDDLLTKAFGEIQEQRRTILANDKKVIPDINGCIYHVRSLLGNSLDICSTQQEAEKVASHGYHEYEIWRIFVGSNAKELLIRKEKWQHHNALHEAFKEKRKER